MGVFDVVGSILGGGVTGILGIGLQKVFEFKTKKLEIELEMRKGEHEIAMIQAQAAVMAQEWAARSKIATVEAESAMYVEDSKTFAASYNEPKKYSEGVHYSKGQGWLLLLLDFIRGIVRPGLTIYLCVLTTLLYLHAHKMLGEIAIGPDQAISLVNQIIETVLYLSSACVLWWFGIRSGKK